MEAKLTEEEVALFYLLRNEILDSAKKLIEGDMSHTDAATDILYLSNQIEATYEAMAIK